MNAAEREVTASFLVARAHILANRKTSTLEAVRALGDLENETHYALIDAVRAAREDRRTWRQIGTELDMSPQGAQQRFGQPGKAGTAAHSAQDGLWPAEPSSGSPHAASDANAAT